MKQVVVIGGGTTFARYEDYIESLRTKVVRIDRIAYSPSWKQSLQERLGSEYLVLIPSMPNTANAKYSEWKIYFDRVVEVLEDDCILLGHSMGGIFLAKYLSENKLPIRIGATVLIAAPFSDETAEDLDEFKTLKGTKVNCRARKYMKCRPQIITFALNSQNLSLH